MSLRQAVILGAVTGLRSVAGLAAYIDHASRLPEANGNASLPDIVRSRDAARLVRAMQVGEVVMDKLPFIPARTSTFPLLGRAVFGGVVGALAYHEDGKTGAFFGALMAVVGSVLGYRVRKALREEYGIPDLVLAAVEDAVTVTVARYAVEDGE
ncbi:MAG: hypothetical protein U0670_23730 [Anaerolineae bacterium]